MVLTQTGKKLSLTEVEELALDLMRQYALLDSGWSFKFDRATQRFGQCNFRLKTISLSKVLAPVIDESEVRDTLLHEIAHAIAGYSAGHGRKWKELFISMGGSGKRTSDYDVPVTIYTWVGTCPQGHEVGMSRQPKRVQFCLRCSRKFSPSNMITWKKNGETVQMSPEYLRNEIYQKTRFVRGS